MDKARLKYALSNSLWNGVFWGVLFSFSNAVLQNMTLRIEMIFVNTIIGITFSFIWSYFEYKSFLKQKMRKESLAEPKQFRCFECGDVVLPEEKNCSKCGWDWIKK